MFTGIIEAQGTLSEVHRSQKLRTLGIKVPAIFSRLKIGASVAVNGVCLTVVKRRGRIVFFNLVSETRKKSNLGDLGIGDFVNLERPLKSGARIEGHLVLGHVDGRGQVRKIITGGHEKSFLIRFPKRLERSLVEKGSIAVDGVSLTLGKVVGNSFWIHCIPHTLKNTTLSRYRVNAKVNLETDLLAKMVASLD